MISKKEFIEEIENKFDMTKLTPEAQEYWEALKTDHKKDKPLFTDNGKLILCHLRDRQEKTTWRASEIAEELFISSRTVSGAIRKLVTDGFVEKIGSEPVIYALTNSGKEVEII